MDGHIMRCGTTSSCQSAAAAQSAAGHESDSRRPKQCCNKCDFGL